MHGRARRAFVARLPASIAGLDGAGIAALLASDRAPIASYRVGVKKDMASHLAPGLTWPSGACDIP